jgi:hypothetical protein
MCVIWGVIVTLTRASPRQSTKAQAEPPEKLSRAGAASWPEMLAFLRGSKRRASESLPPSHYILWSQYRRALLHAGMLALVGGHKRRCPSLPLTPEAF